MFFFRIKGLILQKKCFFVLRQTADRFSRETLEEEEIILIHEVSLK